MVAPAVVVFFAVLEFNAANRRTLPSALRSPSSLILLLEEHGGMSKQDDHYEERNLTASVASEKIWTVAKSSAMFVAQHTADRTQDIISESHGSTRYTTDEMPIHFTRALTFCLGALLFVIGVAAVLCTFTPEWDKPEQQQQEDDSKSDDSDLLEEVSIKFEIARRVPVVNDAASFREARQVLQQLGGTRALKEELVSLGFVDGVSGHLTIGDVPFNIFARIAAGKTAQEDMDQEQAALGDYATRFIACRNIKERDDLWNSTVQQNMRIASMSRKHRMLTTKNLSWQWFNPLVFGLIPPEEGGASRQESLRELEAMKAAALQYAKTVGGYSDNVGLYVNCYGHSEVNALFLHILDDSALGPSFKLHNHKNCPIDEILHVLREEATDAVEKGETPEEE